MDVDSIIMPLCGIYPILSKSNHFSAKNHIKKHCFGLKVHMYVMYYAETS